VSALAVVIGAVLAGTPSGAAIEGRPELQPARLYLAGRRAEALGALSVQGEIDKRRELGLLHELRKVHEPSAGTLLRAAIMLHTDRAQAGRGPSAGAETPRACGFDDDDVLARTIAGYAVERLDSREFVRRWFVAMARQSQWDLCLEDVRAWTDAGLKWFARDPELSLARGLGAEAAVRFARPHDGHPTGNRAVVRRDLDEARDAYRLALSSAPDLLEARLGLGRTLWRQGEYDEARDELERVARDARDPALLYLARLFLARVHDDASRPADAERAYREALVARPSAQAAAFGLAELQARGGDGDGSRASLQPVLGAAPRADGAGADPYTFYHLGLGQVQELMDALREETLQ
jgi:tetratricopeptide (TPR) repeat protein